MKTVREYFLKYKGLISYAFFGACTTLINWGAYYLCYHIARISNISSTITAWTVAVVFAFITNKIWVFNSKSFNGKTVLHEACTFVAARLATGVLDVAIMYYAVDVFALNSTVWKLLSNGIVIIFNYILSKLIIFKKDNSDGR